MKIDFIDIETERVIKVTEKAVLIVHPLNEDEEQWVPRSTLSSKTDKAIEGLEGEAAILQIHTWFVNKEGLR